MSFKSIVKKFDEGTVSSPGKIYIPAAVREIMNLEVGDKVKILVDNDNQEMLVKKKEE